MAERFDVFADADLETALRDLGAALAIPAVAAADGLDPAGRARLRITRDAATIGDRPRRWSWLAPARGRRAGRGLVLALISLLVVAAVAGAIGLGLPGIRIVPAPTASPTSSPTTSSGPSAALAPTPSPTPTPRPTIADPLGSNLGLGNRIAIGEAAAAVDIPVVLPTAAGVGDPATAWLLDGRLAFVWRSSPTLRETSVPGVGLLLSQFRGEVDPAYFQKIVDQGTTLTTVSVDGVTGYWISGAPHEIVYVDEHGDPQWDTRRSVGDALLWARGEVTYRLESGLSQAATIALAESLR